MQNYNETLQNLLNSAKNWDKIERIPITNAANRIVCEDILAKKSYPEFTTSAMDGYAIKCGDQNLGRLKILGQIPAGSEPKFALNCGECVKTFTGALITNGADTIIPIENVEVDGDEIIIKNAVNKGFAVRQIGESYKSGDLLIKKGTKLGYCEIALLAELGFSYTNVFIRPKVAVLSTGNEIIDIGETTIKSSQIHSSNHIAIANMVSAMGCEVVILPIIKDDINLIKQTILNTLESADFLITTGGVSVGDFDFIRDIVRDFEIIVDKAAIKPGRHIKIAKFGGKYIFALPGFPYSAMVTCAIYFREFINKILGTNENYRYKAVLNDDYAKKSAFEEFSAAEIFNENGVIKISTSNKKSGSSAIVVNLGNHAVLLNCPMEKQGLKKGEIVEYIVMP